MPRNFSCRLLKLDEVKRRNFHRRNTREDIRLDLGENFWPNPEESACILMAVSEKCIVRYKNMILQNIYIFQRIISLLKHNSYKYECSKNITLLKKHEFVFHLKIWYRIYN